MSSAPLVRIGQEDGDPAYQFHGIVGVARIHDDQIVVADRGSNELRFFDAQGRHLATVGGAGDGPGEFRGLAGLYRAEGDSLLAYDFQHRRMSLFASDGVFVRSFSLHPVDGASFPSAAGVFGDGSILVRGLPFVGERSGQTGVVRDPMVYYRMTESGTIDPIYGDFPGLETYVEGTQGNVSARILPFGRTSVAAAGQDFFVVGLGDAHEVEVRSPGGELLRIVRVRRDARPVTSDHVEHLERQIGEEALNESMRQMMERPLRETPLPEVLPPYGDFIVDSEGSLWVGDYLAAGDETRTWTVFSPYGSIASRLELESAFSLRDIAREHVVGVRTDDLGVEYVEIYGLARNEN